MACLVPTLFSTTLNFLLAEVCHCPSHVPRVAFFPTLNKEETGNEECSKDIEIEPNKTTGPDLYRQTCWYKKNKVEEIMKLTYTVTLHRHVVEQAVPEQQSLNVDDMVWYLLRLKLSSSVSVFQELSQLSFNLFYSLPEYLLCCKRFNVFDLRESSKYRTTFRTLCYQC